MVLVRWVRRLLSLPLQWLGQTLLMFKSPLSVPLLAAAWHVSGDGQVGRLALSASHLHRGPQAAWDTAMRWLESRPTAEVAGLAGLMAVDRGQFDQAAGLLATGRAHDRRREPILDLLEFFVAVGHEDDAVAERFDTRRDLSPDLTRRVREELAWRAMLAGDFEQARQRVKRLLAIEDNPQAEMVMWALARRDGDTLAAEKHFARAASLSNPPRQYFEFLGLLALGEDASAREVLDQLRAVNARVAAHGDTLLSQRGAKP